MTKDKPKPAVTTPGSRPATPAPATPAAKPGAPAALPGSGDESSRISRIDALGNVIVSTPTDIGRGDYGVYNADTGLVTLLGNVTITRGDNAIRGQYAVVDLNNKVSRMMPTVGKPGSPSSRVEGLFIRQTQPGAAIAPGPNAAPASEKKP